MTCLMPGPRPGQPREHPQSQHLWTWCLTQHLLLASSLPWQTLNLQLLRLMPMHGQEWPGSHRPGPGSPHLTAQLTAGQSSPSEAVRQARAAKIERLLTCSPAFPRTLCQHDGAQHVCCFEETEELRCTLVSRTSHPQCFLRLSAAYKVQARMACR